MSRWHCSAGGRFGARRRHRSGVEHGARAWRIALVLALGGLLGACTPEGPSPDAAPDAAAPDEGRAVTPLAEDPTGGRAVAPHAPAPDTPRRQLKVTVEGQVELRDAGTFRSPQGYAIDVPAQIVMTAEEPCCDLAWARVDDGFFMRIQRLGDGAAPAGLREDMVLGLSAVGEASPVPPSALPPVVRDADPALQARNDEVTLTMLVAEIDGARFRITLHAPHREAAEGIVPTFHAMLGSLRVAGSAAADDDERVGAR